METSEEREEKVMFWSSDSFDESYSFKYALLLAGNYKDESRYNSEIKKYKKLFKTALSDFYRKKRTFAVTGL